MRVDWHIVEYLIYSVSTARVTLDTLITVKVGLTDEVPLFKGISNTIMWTQIDATQPSE